jgi:lipopolysaccharide transport system ATP-binding protein
MSDAIRFDGVGKMYKIFASRRDNLVDALGFDRFLAREPRYREFWALRDIDLRLERGGRLGIIGRNGSGKSTLLKLVTGNLPPTTGTIDVEGEVQALLEVGGGLHPEFTGRENVTASLGFLGLSAREIADATEDIAEFTELGRFLDQPFKTYSLGMQARLSFGIATTIRPEILIVDEILGAGDAYFFTKSTARMQHLIDSGASILLVSHALDQIVRFCERAVWLDRGRIAMEGPSNEVVKAYERFIRELEDRRLQAKNEKARHREYDAFDRESFTDAFLVRLAREADDGDFEIRSLTLLRDDAREESLEVGGAQDADPTASAALVLEAGGWSGPLQEDDTYFRRVEGEAGTSGLVRFSLWFFYPQSRYALEIAYRAGEAGAAVEFGRMVGEQKRVTLPPAREWTTAIVELSDPSVAGEGGRDEGRVSRWPGVEGFAMESVRMVDARGVEQAVFQVHEPMSVLVDIRAEATGTFDLTPAALVFRLDGIVSTRHVGRRVQLDVEEGDRLEARLDLGPLLLGNGSYLLSVGLYRELDVNNTLSSTIYDYFDRSFEFVVTGSPPLHTEAFRHPGEWELRRVEGAEPAPPVAAPSEEAVR